MAGGGLLAAAGVGLSAAGILALKRARAAAWLRTHVLPEPATAEEKAAAALVAGTGAKPGVTPAATGANVCIYQLGHGGETAFASVCNQLQRDRGYERHGVRSRDELQRVLRQYPSYHRLVMAAHGDPSWYFAGFGSINPQWMARQLNGRINSNTIISLAGCRAGADPGTPEYESVPGGSNSFAARLRDLLLQQGAPSGGQIRAHTTTGHTTDNPFARTFDIRSSSIGGAGRDVTVARGDPAERWILALAGYQPGMGINIDPISALGIAAIAGGIGLGLYGLYSVVAGPESNPAEPGSLDEYEHVKRQLLALKKELEFEAGLAHATGPTPANIQKAQMLEDRLDSISWSEQTPKRDNLLRSYENKAWGALGDLQNAIRTEEPMSPHEAGKMQGFTYARAHGVAAAKRRFKQMKKSGGLLSGDFATGYKKGIKKAMKYERASAGVEQEMERAASFRYYGEE